MIDRLTDPARRMILRAGTEAEKLGHAQVGTEHLLVAALLDPATVSAQVVGSLVLDLDRMQRALIAVQRAGTAAPETKASLSPEAKDALDAAARYAQEMRHSEVGTGHLLVGILDDTNATWAPVVAALGITRRAVFDSVVLSHPTSTEATVNSDIRMADGSDLRAEVVSLRAELATMRDAMSNLALRVRALETSTLR